MFFEGNTFGNTFYFENYILDGRALSTYYSCEILDPNYTYSDPANPHVELTHSNETIFATNLQQNPLSLPQKLSGAAFFYPGEFNVYGVDGNADISWVKDDNGVWKRTYKFFDNKGSMIIKIKEGSDVPTDIVDYEPYGTPINLMDSFNENIFNERLAYIGREKDYESGLGDHGVRKLDYFTGSFTTPDAMWEKYIGLSPYHYSANDPVNYLDWNGYFRTAEVGSKNYLNQTVKKDYNQSYPTFMKVLDQASSYVMNNMKVLNALAEATGYSKREIINMMQDGSGPTIFIDKIGANGLTSDDQIIINVDLVKHLENDNFSEKQRIALATFLFFTTLHEFVHTSPKDQNTSGEANAEEFETNAIGDRSRINTWDQTEDALEKGHIDPVEIDINKVE